MDERTEVLRLRAEGKSYRAIDDAMGRPGTNGNWSWRLCRGGDGAGHPPERVPFGASISLWIANAGGRSFKAVAAMLAANGIRAIKGDKSPWEDRYEILVAEANRTAAEDLLFAPVPGAEFRCQSLDALKDATK